jgi:hypothetical protein
MKFLLAIYDCFAELQPAPSMGLDKPTHLEELVIDLSPRLLHVIIYDYNSPDSFSLQSTKTTIHKPS